MTTSTFITNRGAFPPAETKTQDAVMNLVLERAMGQVMAPPAKTEVKEWAWRFPDGRICFLADCSKEELLSVVLPDVLNQLRTLQEQLRGEQALKILTV